MTAYQGRADPSIEEQIQADFHELCRRGHSEARAIAVVAIDLSVSINDCIAAIGRDDLAAQITDHWTLKFPPADPPRERAAGSGPAPRGTGDGR